MDSIRVVKSLDKGAPSLLEVDEHRDRWHERVPETDFPPSSVTSGAVLFLYPTGSFCMDKEVKRHDSMDILKSRMMRDACRVLPNDSTVHN